MIYIWEPKYSTNECLIATTKVAQGKNEIMFTKAKHLQGKIFECSSDDIFNSHIVTNGKIACYAVPMEKLHLVENKENVLYNNDTKQIINEVNTMDISRNRKIYDKVCATLKSKLATSRNSTISLKWDDGNDVFIHSYNGHDWFLYINSDLVVGDVSFDYICKVVTDMVIDYNNR